MADTKDKKQPGSSQEDLWAAIGAFEQILEIMPNDRASLDTLSRAYEQIGDMTRALDMMLRLGDVLIGEADAASARDLRDRIVAIAAADPRCSELVARIDGMTPSEVAAPTGTQAEQEARTAAEAMRQNTDEALKRSFEMAEELAFAWNLLEGGELQQDEYASVVHDLTEMSAGNAAATVSLLHVLEGRQFKNLGRIMAYTAERCRTPVISLDSFEMKGEIVDLLPLPFIVERGAVVFDLLDRDALVVVLNPFNKQLRGDLQTLLRRKVHAYLSLPSEFDNAVKRTREAIEARDAEKAKG
jgi:hypothetical protein